MGKLNLLSNAERKEFAIASLKIKKSVIKNTTERTQFPFAQKKRSYNFPPKCLFDLYQQMGLISNMPKFKLILMKLLQVFVKNWLNILASKISKCCIMGS